MRKFQVIADSTSDLLKQMREETLVDYVKMSFTIDNKEYQADLDWVDLSADEYYNLMRNGNRSITSLVTVKEYLEVFTKYLDQGLDILYLACSSKLSGSINNAKIVAEELKEKYPDRTIICVDSLRSNLAQGKMAYDAQKLALEGKEIRDVVSLLENEKLCYNTVATVGTLEWLKKAGRIRASKAFFGNLFGVKPIIIADAAGNNYAYKKIKGRKASLDELVATVGQRLANISEATVYVEHANCLEDAEYVRSQIMEIVKPKNVIISDLGPIIGATTGPDTITVNFYGEKVTIIGDE